MKTFCKLTAQSPAASYVPLPRFLLQDEALRDISNDAKVLYALLQLLGWRLSAAGRCLPAVYLPQPDLPVVPPRRTAPAAKAGTGHPQPQKLRRCEVCGTGILARSGRAKYCPACAKEVHRQQKAKSASKRRSGVDNLGAKSP